VRERVGAQAQVQERAPEQVREQAPREQVPVPRAQARVPVRVQAPELQAPPVRELRERVQPVQVPPRQDGWPTETVVPG